jgi:hypothetical protein
LVEVVQKMDGKGGVRLEEGSREQHRT